MRDDRQKRRFILMIRMQYKRANKHHPQVYHNDIRGMIFLRKQANSKCNTVMTNLQNIPEWMIN